MISFTILINYKKSIEGERDGKVIRNSKNPEPFEKGTQEIWLDPDRADLVLKSHFDENIPGGSRESSFIDGTVDFINKIAPVEKFKRLLT